jgi:hypothetical protein
MQQLPCANAAVLFMVKIHHNSCRGELFAHLNSTDPLKKEQLHQQKGVWSKNTKEGVLHTLDVGWEEKRILAIWLVESKSLFVGLSHWMPMAKAQHPPKCLYGNTICELWCQEFV